jgi:hypothetical protein
MGPQQRPEQVLTAQPMWSIPEQEKNRGYPNLLARVQLGED